MVAALVLLSALLHATWNAMLRLERDKDRALVAAVMVATLCAAAVAGVRWSFGELPFSTLASVGWTLGAGVLEWLYFATLAQALQRGALGPVYTVSRGGAILLVWPVSIVYFGEPLTIASAGGSAIVLAGLALASARSGDARTTGRDALAWAAACAASIAGYHLAYKGALAAGGSPSAVFAVALGVASLINIVRVGRGGRATIAALARTRGLRLVAMGAICGGAFLLLMEALAAGGAGYILTLRNTSVLFAIGLAVLIGDRPRRAEVAGAAFVAAGAILMAWPTE